MWPRSPQLSLPCLAPEQLLGFLGTLTRTSIQTFFFGLSTLSTLTSFWLNPGGLSLKLRAHARHVTDTLTSILPQPMEGKAFFPKAQLSQKPQFEKGCVAASAGMEALALLHGGCRSELRNAGLQGRHFLEGAISSALITALSLLQCGRGICSSGRRRGHL